MKITAICVVIIFSTAVSSIDPAQFVNSTLQGTFGWAHPSSFQTCKAKALDMYNSYTNIWMSFFTLRRTNVAQAFQQSYELFTAEPRCYFATNVAAQVVEFQFFKTLFKAFWATPIEPLVTIAYKLWKSLVMLPSAILTFWAFVSDVRTVIAGTYTEQNLGYIAATFLKSMFRKQYH